MRKTTKKAAPKARADTTKGIDKEKLKASLIAGAEAAGPVELLDVAIGLIDESPHNPRGAIDKEELRGLADSIKQNGLLQPLVVSRNDDGKRYLVIFGHRRLAALKLIRATTARCLVRSPIASVTSRVLQIIENLQRSDIAPLDEARALASLQDEDPATWTPIRIGHEIGRSDRFVAQRIAIARNLLPELQQKLAEGKMKVEVARTLARAPQKLQKKMIGDYYALENPETCRRKLLEAGIPIGTNAFKLEPYTGEFLEDDDGKGTRYFADVAQFDRLQRQVAEERALKLQKKWPGAKLVGAKEVGDRYYYADNGGYISDYSARAEVKKPAKGLAPEDVTALVWLASHKIRTVKGVVLKETWKAKAQKARRDQARHEASEQADIEVAAQRDRLNHDLCDRLQVRPDIAHRLFVYGCIGALSRLDYRGDLRIALSPWTDELGEYFPVEKTAWRQSWSPPSPEDNPLFRLLLRLDDGTIDAMLGRLVATCMPLEAWGVASAMHCLAFGAVDLELPARLKPALAIEVEVPAEPAEPAAAEPPLAEAA